MKIIHCLNQYMPQAMGGTEIYTQMLATFQKRSGHEVAVMTPHINYYRPGEINEHYVHEEIDVYQFLENADPTDRQIHYGKKKPEGLNNFISLIGQLKPGVIHFHEINRSIGFTLAHVKFAKQSGAKVFVTMHLPFYSCNTNVLIYNNELCDGIIRNFRCTVCSYETLFNVPPILAKPLTVLSMGAKSTLITPKLRSGKTRTLLSVPSTITRIKKELKELCDNVDRLISLNTWYKKMLVKNGVPENKLTIVPQALVTTAKNTAGKIYRPPGLPVKMVFIGRIHPIKGIHLIIEAVRSFLPGQVYIDIYGRPEDNLYYKQCISESSGIDSIRWKGELKREEVVEKLTHYDIFCLASTSSEMAPLVIQEAFAAGIPVLASRVYGNLEQIQHGHNGLIFEFNSSKSLSDQIQRLINEPALLPQLKRNVAAPPDFNIVNEAYLELYASA